MFYAAEPNCSNEDIEFVLSREEGHGWLCWVEGHTGSDGHDQIMIDQ